MGELINDVLSTIVFMELYYCLFKDNSNFNRKTIVTTAIVFLSGFFSASIIGTPLVSMWIEIGIDLVAAIVLLRESISYKLIAFMLCYTFAGVCDIVITWGISKIVNMPLLSALDTLSIIIIEKICVICIFAVIAGIVFKRKSKVVISIWNCILLAIQCALCALILFCLANYQMNAKMKAALEYATIFTSITSIGICLILILINSARKKVETEKRVQDAYMQLQNQYYKQIKRKEQETRILYHDMKEHIDMLCALGQKQDYAGLGDYLGVLKGKIEQTRQAVPNLGNDVIDSILMQKIGEAKDKGIDLKYKGKVTKEIPVKPFDLVTIIGNLLQNGIEYCEYQGYKKIWFEIGNFRDNLYIGISNPIKEAITLEKMLGNTRKKDKYSHGFGMQNVKDTVEQYNGELTVQCHDNKIFINIILFAV